ncbi:ArsB/NhaD family transporter [Komagataeibacter rhaeticus]
MLALAAFRCQRWFLSSGSLGGWASAGAQWQVPPWHLATGVIHWHDIPVVWHIVWDATFTFIALIIISLLLDGAGFFHWAALHVVRWGKGRGRTLFPLIVVLGAAIAAVFANDGAALLLTPIVIAILTQLRLSHGAALAFIIATGFVADTTSLPLVISNLVNIVSANFFDIPFDRYAAIMVPVDLAALGATLAVLWLWYRRQVPADLSRRRTASTRHRHS